MLILFKMPVRAWFLNPKYNAALHGRGKEVSLGIDVGAFHCYVMEKEIIEKNIQHFAPNMKKLNSLVFFFFAEVRLKHK